MFLSGRHLAGPLDTLSRCQHVIDMMCMSAWTTIVLVGVAVPVSGAAAYLPPRVSSNSRDIVTFRVSVPCGP